MPQHARRLVDDNALWPAMPLPKIQSARMPLAARIQTKDWFNSLKQNRDKTTLRRTCHRQKNACFLVFAPHLQGFSRPNHNAPTDLNNRDASDFGAPKGQAGASSETSSLPAHKSEGDNEKHPARRRTDPAPFRADRARLRADPARLRTGSMPWLVDDEISVGA